MIFKLLFSTYEIFFNYFGAYIIFKNSYKIKIQLFWFALLFVILWGVNYKFSFLKVNEINLISMLSIGLLLGEYFSKFIINSITGILEKSNEANTMQKFVSLYKKFAFLFIFIAAPIFLNISQLDLICKF